MRSVSSVLALFASMIALAGCDGSETPTFNISDLPLTYDLRPVDSVAFVTTFRALSDVRKDVTMVELGSDLSDYARMEVSYSASLDRLILRMRDLAGVELLYVSFPAYQAKTFKNGSWYALTGEQTEVESLWAKLQAGGTDPDLITTDACEITIQRTVELSMKADSVQLTISGTKTWEDLAVATEGPALKTCREVLAQEKVYLLDSTVDGDYDLEEGYRVHAFSLDSVDQIETHSLDIVFNGSPHVDAAPVTASETLEGPASADLKVFVSEDGGELAIGKGAGLAL